MRWRTLAVLMLGLLLAACALSGAEAYAPRHGEFEEGFYVVVSLLTGRALTVDFENLAEDGTAVILKD